MIRSGLLVLLLALGACAKQDARQRTGPFFALDAFLDQETARLAGGMTVTKTVILDLDRDSLTLETYTWQSELELLGQWDLNRPAWRDQYRRDTLPAGTDRIHCRYTALDEDLPVQEFQTWLQKGKPDSLLIRTRVSNPLHTTEGTYFYQPGKIFRFQQRNLRRFGKDQSLKVRVSAAP